MTGAVDHQEHRGERGIEQPLGDGAGTAGHVLENLDERNVVQAERLAPPDEDLERRRHHRHARAHARRPAERVQQLVLPGRIGCDDHLVDVVTHAQRREVLAPPEHRDPVERGAPRPVQAARGDTHDVEPEPLLRADGRDHLGRRGVGPDHQHAAPGIAAEQRRAAEPPDQQEARR